MSKEPAYTESVNRLIERLGALPGIGRRTAERLAFFLLKAPPEEALALARSIEQVKQNVRHCSQCFNLTESDPCPICGDAQREQRRILIVEQPRDLVSIEQSGAYDGVYHVLLGHLSPLEGIGPSDLSIDALIERVRGLAGEGEGEQPVEAILGTNPNMEGDGTALYIAERLAEVSGVQVSRLARGLPAGTQLEYASKAVLSDAIQSRHQLP